MTGSYTAIREAEFVEFLNDVAAFERVSPPRTHEIVFDLPLPADHLSIRIYSTIDEDTGIARACGDDAIRCLVWNHDIEKPISGRIATLRIETWRSNLRPKIKDLYASWREYDRQCPECGSVMCEREANGGFMGCTAYPACEHTEPLAVDI